MPQYQFRFSIQRRPWILAAPLLIAGCVNTQLLNSGGLTLRLGKDKEVGSTEAIAMAGGFDDMRASFITSTFVVIGSEGGKHDFTAYVAGNLEQEDATAEGSLSAADPTLHLSSGWAYAYGNHPIVQTPRTRITGGGTRFIIEITSTCDRVYLIPETGEHRIMIECLGSDPPATLELFMQGQYVEMRDDCSMSGPRDVIGSPQHGFVVNVRDAVIRQNLEWFTQHPWP